MAFTLTLFFSISLINFLNFKKQTKHSSQINVSAWTGSGTESDPYLITSKSDMNTLASNVNSGTSYYKKYFKLTTDLDYAVDQWGNQGDFTPVGFGASAYGFSGTFDGAGHTISNTKVTISYVQSSGLIGDFYAGVFGYMNGATIKNLKSENMYVLFSGTNVSNFYIGGIAGVSHWSTISYCEVENLKVSSYEYDSSTYETTSAKVEPYVGVGGIAGLGGYGSTIEYCKGEVDSVDFSYASSSDDLTVSVTGICNDNTNYGTYINYCWGAGGLIYGSNITKYSRDISNFIPYDCYDYTISAGSDSNGDGYRDGWVDYTSERGSTVYVKYCHTSWYEDWKLLGYKNLSPSSSWGSTGSTWFFDSDNYGYQPYLRQFMKWYTYTFKPAYITSAGDIVEMNSVISIIENAPGNNGRVASYYESPTTILGKPISYTATEGYTFYQWQKQSVDETSLSVLWYALLKLTDYTISYDYAGGTEMSNLATYNVETASFTLVNPTRVGYKFLGWTGSNGATPQTSVTISQGSTGNRTYTANWELIDYNITYNLDGGGLQSGKSNPATYNITTATFTLNNPTKSGYTFIGWSGTGLAGTTNQTVTITQGSIGERSYTANWQEVSYSISYNLDYGTKEQVYKESYTIKETPFSLTYTPIRKGYTFTGWSGSGLSGAENKTISVASGTIGNLSYTANWEITKIAITFKNVSTATLKVDGVLQTGDYTVIVYYGKTLETAFDGANNSYSYTVENINGITTNIVYTPNTNDMWVSVFNIPLDNSVSSRQQPKWTVNDEDLGGIKSLTITPTISLKVYEGSLK